MSDVLASFPLYFHITFPIIVVKEKRKETGKYVFPYSPTMLSLSERLKERIGQPTNRLEYSVLNLHFEFLPYFP